MAKQPKKLVLGIDTGGTYTDGVLLDYETHEVLAEKKSLTTKRDFAIGIEDVIAGIHIDDPSEIKMVSISTTLATNAIAEGKGKRVALFLVGYDPELIDSFNLSSHFATPLFDYFGGGHDLYGSEKEPLDLQGILEKVKLVKNKVDAIAVSSYFSPLNPEHETRAYDAIAAVTDLPVVLGHQLSTKLGSVERATTAALNASLLAILQEFIIAVKRALNKRAIEAPLMVVRGDGTLMSDEFAARSPVETIHSGPAASAIGGRFLSNIDNALVMDVGGTTTDLALIVDGKVTVSEEGASVSGYKTSVHAADLLSIGLGGDSHIQLNRQNELLIGPERVMPLAYLSYEHPQVKDQLYAFKHHTWERSSPEWLEYLYLIREPEDPALMRSERQQQVMELLKKSPQAVPQIAKKMGVFHLSQLGVDALLQQEIIGRAGFTPTDLLHVDGRYAVWDTAASAYALKVMANFMGEDLDKLQSMIWERITEKIVQSVLVFVSGNPLPLDAHNKQDMASWFFYNAIYDQHPHLASKFQLSHPLIGIGGPADMFLKKAAEVLDSELVLPKHYRVANAVGAVAGNIMVTEEVLVYPKLSKGGLDVISYFIQSSYERLEIEELEEALRRARAKCEEYVISAALRSGAAHPEVLIQEINDGLDTYRVQGKAFGKPRLA